MDDLRDLNLHPSVSAEIVQRYYARVNPDEEKARRLTDIRARCLRLKELGSQPAVNEDGQYYFRFDF